MDDIRVMIEQTESLLANLDPLQDQIIGWFYREKLAGLWEILDRDADSLTFVVPRQPRPASAR